MQPVCSPAGEQDGGGPVRLPAALSGSWPAPARGIAGAQPCLGAVCGTAMPHNSGGGGGGGNPAPAASSWVFHKPDPSVFKSPRRCPGHSELLGFMPFYFAGLVDKVWSGTPIRDNGCCYHPLTGVPCLRPGPCTGWARLGYLPAGGAVQRSLHRRQPAGGGLCGAAGPDAIRLSPAAVEHLSGILHGN